MSETFALWISMICAWLCALIAIFSCVIAVKSGRRIKTLNATNRRPGCDICGSSKGWNGQRCSACQYTKPPEAD